MPCSGQSISTRIFGGVVLWAKLLPNFKVTKIITYNLLKLQLLLLLDEQIAETGIRFGDNWLNVQSMGS